MAPAMRSVQPSHPSLGKRRHRGRSGAAGSVSPGGAIVERHLGTDHTPGK